MLTFLLYYGSFLINTQAIGALVVYVLDWSEVFISLSKTFSETKFKRVLAVSGVLMLVSWWYFRIFAFPIVFYQGLYTLPRQIPGYYSDNMAETRFVFDTLFGLCTFL